MHGKYRTVSIEACVLVVLGSESWHQQKTAKVNCLAILAHRMTHVASQTPRPFHSEERNWVRLARFHSYHSTFNDDLLAFLSGCLPFTPQVSNFLMCFLKFAVHSLSMCLQLLVHIWCYQLVICVVACFLHQLNQLHQFHQLHHFTSFTISPALPVLPDHQFKQHLVKVNEQLLRSYGSLKQSFLM